MTYELCTINYQLSTMSYELSLANYELMFGQLGGGHSRASPGSWRNPFGGIPGSFRSHSRIIPGSFRDQFGSIPGFAVWIQRRFGAGSATGSSEIATLFKTVSRPKIGFQNFRRRKRSNKTVSQTVSRAYVVVYPKESMYRLCSVITV